MWFLVIGLCWILPWAIIPQPPVSGAFWTLKSQLWIIGGLALGFWNWGVRKPAQGLPNPWVRWLALYLLLFFWWQVLQPHLWVPVTHQTAIIYDWKVSWFYPFWSLLASLVAATALIQQTDSLQRWVVIAHQLGLVSLPLAAYSLLQCVGLDQLLHVNVQMGTIDRYAPIATFGNPMLTGNFLAPLAPFLLMFKGLRYRLGFLLVSLVILLTKSASSLGAWILGVGLYLALNRQWRFFFLFLAGLLTGAGYWAIHHDLTSYLNLSGRLEAWLTIYPLWGVYAPYTGLGLGAVETLATNGWWTWASLHNEPYQVLIECGILGFLLFLGACLHLFRRLWRTPMSVSLAGWTAAGAAYGLISLVGFPWRVGDSLMLGVLIWSSLEAHTGGSYA